MVGPVRPPTPSFRGLDPRILLGPSPPFSPTSSNRTSPGQSDLVSQNRAGFHGRRSCRDKEGPVLFVWTSNLDSLEPLPFDRKFRIFRISMTNGKQLMNDV